ncbi:MAG: AAA family ATPase, partial [Promethearchaeota archaeon]
MELNRIQVNNFKSFKQFDLSLRKITLLFGPNNCGKSNILRFFMLLKQTFESEKFQQPLVINGRFIELGTYRDIAFQSRKFQHCFNIVLDENKPNQIEFQTKLEHNEKLRQYELKEQRINSKFKNEELIFKNISDDLGFSLNKMNIKDFNNKIREYLSEMSNEVKYILSSNEILSFFREFSNFFKSKYISPFLKKEEIRVEFDVIGDLHQIEKDLEHKLILKLPQHEKVGFFLDFSLFKKIRFIIISKNRKIFEALEGMESFFKILRKDLKENTNKIEKRKKEKLLTSTVADSGIIDS